MFRDLAPLYSYMRATAGDTCGHPVVHLHQLHLGALSPGHQNGRRRHWRQMGDLSQVLQWAVDTLSHGDTRIKVLIFAGLLVAIALIKASSSTPALDSHRHLAGDRVRPAQRSLQKLEEQDSGFYQRYRTGDIMARLTNDLMPCAICSVQPSCTAPTRSSSPWRAVFLLRISPWLTLVAFAPMPLASVLVQYFGSRIHDRFERIQASFSDISSQARKLLRRPLGPRFAARNPRSTSSSGSTANISPALSGWSAHGLLWPTLEFVLGISMILTLLVGGHQVIATASALASSWPSTPTWFCSPGPSSPSAGW